MKHSQQFVDGINAVLNEFEMPEGVRDEILDRVLNFESYRADIRESVECSLNKAAHVCAVVGIYMEMTVNDVILSSDFLQDDDNIRFINDLYNRPDESTPDRRTRYSSMTGKLTTLWADEAIRLR